MCSVYLNEFVSPLILAWAEWIWEVVHGTETGDFFCQFDIQVTHFCFSMFTLWLSGRAEGSTISRLPKPGWQAVTTPMKTHIPPWCLWVTHIHMDSCAQTVHTHTHSLVCAHIYFLTFFLTTKYIPVVLLWKLYISEGIKKSQQPNLQYLLSYFLLLYTFMCI